MAHEGRPTTDRSVSYEIEHGMIGALLMYGRTGLAIAQAEGWSPALCRRPQHEALAEWLVEGIEAGAVSDLNTALAHLAMSPPTHRNAPGHSEALLMLCVAPQHAPILEAIPASVRAMAQAVAVERLAVMQAELRDAAGRGDMAAVGQIGKRIAALVAPPKAKAAASEDVAVGGDDRPDPAAIAALKKIPRRARDDRRVQARVVIENDPRWSSLRFNEMKQRAERGGRLYTDADDAGTTDWLSWVYGIQVGRDVAAGVVDLVARKRSYDPLRDYLTGLPWDGVARLDTWMQRGLGVEDGPLQSRMGACWMIGAAARALRPGCQMDTMLVFVGKQGKGKTRAMEAIAGAEFFNETEIRIGEIRGLQQLGDAWIHEIGEMTPLLANRVDRNVFKNFLTVKVDSYQRLHAKRSGEHPRRCVFVGTCNDKELLNDPTGARRFWPVISTSVDLAWIRANRDQLWAEARVRLDSGEQWHLTPTEEAELELLQRPFRKTDPWEEPLSVWLSQPERSHEPETAITAARLLADVISRPLGMQTQADKTRLGACMAAVGWMHKVAWCKTAKKALNCYVPDPSKVEVES
jgi:predicted P-loop ATPase